LNEEDDFYDIETESDLYDNFDPIREFDLQGTDEFNTDLLKEKLLMFMNAHKKHPEKKIINNVTFESLLLLRPKQLLHGDVILEFLDFWNV
jgi:hypothetical protein